jgi:hypothetical protein
MPKEFMKAKGEYISKKNMKIIWGFISFCQKEISRLKEEKNENWGFICWLTKNIYLHFMGKRQKLKVEREE